MWLQQLPNGTTLHDVEAWWDFDNGSLIDRISKRVLTANNAVASATPKHGGDSYTFDGTDDNLTCTDFLTTGAMTICAWITVTNHGEGNNGRIIDNGKLLLFISDTNDLMTFQSDGATSVNTANNSIVDGGEYFICVTRPSGGDNCNAYINGAVSGTADQDSGTPEGGSTDFYIGDRDGDDRCFVGTIGPIIIFNKLLTATQIGQMYNKHK